MPEGVGNAAQARMIAEQVARATIVEFVAEHPELARRESEVPAPLRWAAGIIAAVLTASVVAFCVWMVTTLNEMQITVARIDERQQSQSGDVDGRFEALDRRVSTLESYHRGGDDR